MSADQTITDFSAVGRARSWMKPAPGIALSAVVAGAAAGVEAAERVAIKNAVVEGLVIAIVLGIVVRNLFPIPAISVSGVSFASRTVLEFAVALLGVTIDLRQIVNSGPALVVGAVAAVGSGLAVSFIIGRIFGLSPRLAALIATGSSICGNSAIAAMAPVIGADKRDVASAVSLTAVVGVAAVLTLPFLVRVFGLSYHQYGVVAGMSIYSVTQVIAAAMTVSAESARVAIVVKLMRVMMLGPSVLVLGFLFRSRQGGRSKGVTSYVPWFVVAFLALMTIKTIGIVPAPIAADAQSLYLVLMMVALAALGLGVEFAAVRHGGWRVGAVVAGSFLYLVVLSFVVLASFGVR